MAKKYVIDLTDRGSLLLIEKVLKARAKSLDGKADEITQRLCIEAANEAAKHFSGEVTVTPTGSGIAATGESVVFEEFGAGSRISDPFPGGAEDVSFEIRRGAYSDLHQGEYAQSGYREWHHGGQAYEYITPGNGLFYAGELVRDRAAAVAKEVLKE